MRKLLLLITFISTLFSFGQNKKEYIVDENFKSISDETFKNKLKEVDNHKMKYYYKFYENDTAKIGQVLLFRTKGVVSLDKRKSITDYIYKITGRKITPNQNIVISYYNSEKRKGDCMNFQLKDKELRKYFKNNTQSFQIAFARKENMRNIKNLYIDAENIIRDNLFSEFWGCGNYIIIRPDGRYLKELGEHHPHDIIKDIKSF